jgi:hypothetical protein
MTKLTERRLEAIEEALHARLAGEIEDVGRLEVEDYRAALRWTQERLTKRELRYVEQASDRRPG